MTSLTAIANPRIVRRLAPLAFAALLIGLLGCFPHGQSAAGKKAGSASAASGPSTPPPEPPPPPPDTEHQTDETAGKAADLSKIAVCPKNGSPYLGQRNELVVVNIFSDFQCPVCSRAADPIKQLAIDFPGKVRVVFRNNPLKMHNRSHAAAMAAAAAGRQNKFWQYHDRLFGNQRGLDDASLRNIAENLGLNLDKWEEDRMDAQIDQRISAEALSVVKLGAPGTPGIFVNGWRSLGWGSYQGLKGTVQREIVQGEQLIASGTPRSEVPAARIRATAEQNPKSPNEGPIDPDYWVQVLTAD
jgi:protein-disulfide isomerase